MLGVGASTIGLGAVSVAMSPESASTVGASDSSEEQAGRVRRNKKGSSFSMVSQALGGSSLIGLRGPWGLLLFLILSALRFEC